MRVRVMLLAGSAVAVLGAVAFGPAADAASVGPHQHNEIARRAPLIAKPVPGPSSGRPPLIARPVPGPSGHPPLVARPVPGPSSGHPPLIVSPAVRTGPTTLPPPLVASPKRPACPTWSDRCGRPRHVEPAAPVPSRQAEPAR